MPLASSIVSVPSVGQLHQSGPGTATSWAPHTSGPLPSWGEAPLHTLAQPPNSTSTLGLILSPSSDPIPHRLVSSIQAGEFIEMRDLLADNISLHNQLEDFHGHIWPSTPAHLRPRLREVPSLSSWVYCFCAYIAVLSPDARTRELLAYCRLIIREALRHGGTGWQEYDRTFRRQAAINTSLPWNVLVPGLQAATLLGNRSGPPGLFCGLCREPDGTGQCALSVTQQPASSSSPATFSRRPSCPETVAGICASWNQGRFAFPGYCSFRHICAVCRSNHQGVDCPVAPVGSEYHRHQQSLRSSAAPTASSKA